MSRLESRSFAGFTHIYALVTRTDKNNSYKVIQFNNKFIVKLTDFE